MGFLSATLLLGTLAAGIPVALHLLARQPPRRVIFPAVSFLRKRLTTQTSRLRVRRLWLLAMRVLALIAFAVVLARPHIHAESSSRWITIGLLLLAAAGLLVLASGAFARGLARSLAWALLVAAMVLGCIGGIAGVHAIASGARPQIEGSGPMAIAILIDNSPSSAWRINDDFPNAGPGNEANEAGPSEELRQQSGLDLAGTRLSIALARASDLIESLPGGSRVAIVDRSASPAGFSLDPRAARARLERITPHAVPVPIADRIVAAVELVRTSDLPHRQVVVISDMAAPSWDENVPTSSERSPLAADQHADVPISILNIHERTEFDDRGNTADSQSATASLTGDAAIINPWISPPQVAEVAPAPGTAIPIRFNVGVWNAGSRRSSSSGENSSAGSGTPFGLTATVQLSLYENVPSLPVVRDGKIVLPPLRTVDRASVELAGAAGREVSLTLPPLARGTHHAVVELIGSDRFEWDNQRFLTVELPEPPHVLMVGDDLDETSVMAAAMTAPHAPGDASAGYRIETVSFRDLAAVDWASFELIVLIDPPLRYDAQGQSIVGSAAGISTAMWTDIAGVVSRGGGLVVSLGPATEVLGMRSSDSSDTTATFDSDGGTTADALIPPLVRSWRVPEPGTFWQVMESSHPIFSALMRPTSLPNWSDFRIRRYWQIGDEIVARGTPDPSATQPSVPATWNVIARYAGTRQGGDNEGSAAGHPAVLTRQLGSGRIAVTTTPLPALGKETRRWNDLLGAADAWPAFMTVRGLAAWAAGTDRSVTNILAGQTARQHFDPPADADLQPQRPPTDGDDDAVTRTVELYTPGQASGRQLTVVDSSVAIDETVTPGTYFLRGSKISSGLSVNLSPIWSSDETTQPGTLQKLFGEEGWSITNNLSEMSLIASGSAGAAVSLHGPLMLLAVLIFLAEQVLSNRFYGSSPAPEIE